ncbi:photosynthetic complex assembly protein PuhC [Nitratireductor alexandrii]|uniref:photosynthetic complex assembly protein PuhC n=1 Tax=Nitratireductor alexandrii TaxID=2448161 RepID=UPI000FD73596|nr:photosynthetic complex assembly protein PuhC [Nitratireductor alexandrii]
MASASHLGYLSDRKGRHGNPFPAGILIGAALLLVFAAGAVVFGQATGIGVIKHRTGAPVAIRDITILRGADDIVVVADAASGSRIATYEKDTGGFVRGSLRAFERMRMVAKVSEAVPYRLIKWQAGTVSLSDTATGERIYLEAFGKDNAAAFEALLEARGGAS